MTDFEHEHEVPVTEYGRWRLKQTRAAQRANAQVMLDMLNGAGQAPHEATSRQLRRAHTGLYDDMTPEQAAQNVAERPMTVGSAFGETREVQRHDSPFGQTQHLYGPAVTGRTPLPQHQRVYMRQTTAEWLRENR